MKKILFVLCFLIGFQMQAQAVVVTQYIAPVPNYYSPSAMDFSINIGSPYYPTYNVLYSPYYYRQTYYTGGIYTNSYWNVGFDWGWNRPHYTNHHRPLPRYHMPPPRYTHHGNNHPPSRHFAPPPKATHKRH